MVLGRSSGVEGPCQKRPAVLSVLLLAAFVLAACEAEIKRVPATQTMIRIQADAALQAELQGLRVRTAAARESTWVVRDEQTFARDELRWPVDIVVTPPSEAQVNERFEFVAEALDASDRVLVQARVITGFVLREQRLLVLELSACGSRALGFVCEEGPECIGPTCLTCVAGDCAQAPWVEPSSLDRLTEPTELVSDSGVLDATTETDGSVPFDPHTPDMDGDLPDATVGAEAEAEVPRACDPGSERDDAGVCADVDECARGLDDCDDDPRACVNALNGLGFSCACPTGYRGTGQGPDGCSDIDECAEQTDSCDALAPCNNTPGGYACGSCPSGYTSGAGGGCVDIDECSTGNGGCDTTPLAACGNRTGAANTCACPVGYSGNGVGPDGCVDENECSSNNGGCDTQPMATCHNQVGAANTCSCPSGYSGNGRGASGCVDIPNCTPSSCQHDAGCIDGVNDFTCNCGDSGYTGELCEVDPCNPNPCGSGIACARTQSGTASCTAACATSGGGCQPGDRCVTDADCRTGGDTAASCEPTARVCVRVCPATTIVSQTNLEAARYCKEINGDLKVEPDFATLDASALPYLTRVRGDLLAVNPFGSPAAVSITLGNLQTVDGEVKFGVMTNLTQLNLPRLASASLLAVGSILKLTRLSVPQLTTVTGAFSIGNLPQLGQFDVGRLRSVGGVLQLQLLCKLPYSQVQPISGLGSSRTVAGIGCCTNSSDRFGCDGGCVCN